MPDLACASHEETGHSPVVVRAEQPVAHPSHSDTLASEPVKTSPPTASPHSHPSFTSLEGGLPTDFTQSGLMVELDDASAGTPRDWCATHRWLVNQGC